MHVRRAPRALGSLFSRLTGSKVLTEKDLKPVLEGMKQHLMQKNVAMDIADKILTPKTSTDLLLSIRTKLLSQLASTQQRMPYSIAFVGVNGIGKSTSLSEEWHSGAAPRACAQSRDAQVNGATDSKGWVELFECGYSKDAAGIARKAFAFGASFTLLHFPLPTSTHTQQRTMILMSSSSTLRDNELVAVNTPDKIIFVGEALVGNEAVDQLTKFDHALRDFLSASGMGKGCGIDGMLVTKWRAGR
ncbi:hypothetical protein B0H14DRAFT_3512847 [Mycena olivaceomarginata]|nr:hypothetical protein B0H14DRAFT_3512847 [Mycena olivaceomarginata]